MGSSEEDKGISPPPSSVTATLSSYETIEDPAFLREIMEDDIYLLGGQFAILCQFAHPALAKGSFLHSSFASRIPQRLKNTARFLNVSVYGTPREKEAITSVIHKYHAHVKGDDYNANDKELQKWTAATLFVALAVVHETFFGKLSPSEMDAMYKQSAVFGTTLLMTPDMWPATVEEFWEYWDYNIATLEVTDMARKLANDLLYPQNLPFHMQVLTPVSRILTTHFLPPRLAREYRLEPTAFSRFQYNALVATMRLLYPQLPKSIRQARHTHFMEDLKKAISRVEQSGHWDRELQPSKL